MKKMTVLIALIFLIVACSLSSEEEAEQPLATTPPPAATEAAKAGQPSPVQEATSTGAESAPPETEESTPGEGEATLEPGQEPTATTSLQPVQGPGWKPAGFGGAGNFIGIHFDPSQPGVVYATSDVAGVLRSTDYGDHWEVRSAGMGNYQVSSFVVDPFDSNTLYAGTGALAESTLAGIYVSHDAGLTWEHLESTFTHRITFRRYRTADAIAPDPAHQGVILSGSRDNGIWRSTDGGQSWTQVYEAPLSSAPWTYIEGGYLVEDDPTDTPYPAPASIVLFDLANSNVVYAGFDGAGVARSVDGGVSWEPINSGLPDEAKVKYLAVGSNAVLYAAVGEAGVYKTTDGGDTWQPVNNGLQALLPDHWISSVVVHPGDPDIAYLTVVSPDYPNVWRTTDGGATWTPRWAEPNVTVDPVNDPPRVWTAGPVWKVNPYPTRAWQMDLDPFDPERMIYVDFWSIFRSEDGGEHWVEIAAGAQNTCVTDVVMDTQHPPGEPDVWYATHWDAGLLASTDNGVTWTAVLPPPSDNWDEVVEPLVGHYWRFAIARVGETKYYYVTSDPWDEAHGSQVLRSTDGVNWMTVFNSPRPEGTWSSGYMPGLAVDPSQPSTLYVTQDGGQVWKSTDNGDTWAPTDGQPEGNSFTYALAVDDAGRVFAGTLLDGLWRSTDGGASWQQVLTDQATIWHVVPVPGAVYASSGDDANLYRSTDGGDTWQRLTNFSSLDDGDGVGQQGYAIAVDPNDSNHIFFSLQDTWHALDAGTGVVESTDGGVTWTPLNAGLGHLNVSVLTVGSEGDLLAGTRCAGIWYMPPPTETGETGDLPVSPTESVTPELRADASVDDFEAGDFDDRWWSYVGGETESFTCILDQPGHASAQAMRLTFEVGADGYAGCGLDVDAGRWGEAGGLSFFWRADQPDMTVMLTLSMEDPTQTNPEAEGVTPFEVVLQTPGEEWTAVMLTWDAFAKAEWVGESGADELDPTRVVGLSLDVVGEQSGSVWLDDLQLLAASGAAALPGVSPTPLPALSEVAGPLPTPPAGHIYHAVYPGEEAAEPPEDGIPFEEDGVTLDDLRSYEQHVGKTATWVYFSHNWFRGRSFPLSTASWIRNAGSIPYIRLMLRSSEEQNVAEPTFTLDRIINGDFDDDLRVWARDARDFGSLLIVEYGTEVNGEWFSWNGIWNGAGTLDGYGDPSEYDGPERFRDAYRHIIQIARDEGASNIIWVFHVDGNDVPDEEWNRLEQYYPGNGWIDWLGVSVYGAGEPMDDECPQLRDGLDAVYPRLAALSPDKPMVLLEFGVTAGNPLCDQAAWAEAALEDLITFRWPRVMGFSWWNESWQNDDDPSHDTNMRVQDNSELAAVFQRLVGSEPRVLGKATR